MGFLKKRRTLPAYSVLEVIIALVVLLLVFFIAIQFFSRINYSGFNIQTVTGHNLLEEYIHTTREKRDFNNGRMQTERFIITREFTPHGSTDSLLLGRFILQKNNDEKEIIASRALLIDTRWRISLIPENHEQ